MYKPIEGAKKILKVNLGVKPKESIFVIAEICTAKDAESFICAAEELYLDAAMVVIPDLHFNGENPSNIVQKIMKLPDAMVLATNQSLSTTSAISEALKLGVRAFSIPGFTSEMLIRGPIEADFLEIKSKVLSLSKLLGEANRALITSDNGSNLSFSVKNRSSKAADALAREPGVKRSMSVEVNTAPIEDSANGFLMIDIAAPTNIILDEPLRITFKKGLIVKIEGKDSERLQNFLEEIEDKNIFRIAEFGIGMNPASKLTGKNYIEDESSIGTAHIGIGRNISLGGETRAKGHFDLIFKKPNLFFDSNQIMKNGKLLF